MNEAALLMTDHVRAGTADADGVAEHSPWACSVSAVAVAHGTEMSRGLDEKDVAHRRACDGPNELADEPAPRLWHLLAQQFADVLIVVLIGAALVSGVLLGEWVEAGVIGTIVILNALLGYAQHARAERALTALRDLTAPEADVIRDGERRTVPALDVVRGDVVVLEPGGRVPADGRVVETFGLATAEAVLTGESVPVVKQTAPVARDAPISDRTCMLFAGTTIARGRGRAIVTAIGPGTELGQLAQLMRAEPDPGTPLQRRLSEIGRRLAFGAGLVAALVFVLGLIRGYPTEEIFLTAVALAVAAIPEGLPAAVTVTLARGTQRLAARHALVRQLPAVEALGSATVICTDKTGTLTRNELRVTEIVAARDDGFALVASLCNDARPGPEGWTGDPVDVALRDAAHAAAPDDDVLEHTYPRLDEVGFDATRKRMTTLHAFGDHYLMAVKGAPEEVLARCALDRNTHTALLTRAEALASRGLRTLALARRVVEKRPTELGAAEHGLELVGIVGMLDELRDEAPAAVAVARAAGIRVAMITGDHASTGETVGRQLGIVREQSDVMDAATLRGSDDAALAGALEHTTVFARVDPADKVRIVRALQSRGEIVAMTGDGANDGPALRAADIGIAMGSGTDVGKEAADIVLADDNFATIVAAIAEGRRVFGNLQRLVFFLLAANIAEVLVVAAGLLFFGGGGPPLLATQILWINLVTDGLPVLALAADPAPLDVMRQPPNAGRSLLGGGDQLRLLARGAVLAGACALALALSDRVRELPFSHTRTVVFTTLVTVQLGWAYAVRRTVGNGRRSSPGRNGFLAASVVTVVALQIAVVQTGLGQRLFDTTPLDIADWTLVGFLTLAVYVVLGGFATRAGARVRSWLRRK